MKKYIIFDLDDTLYKEIDFVRSAYQSIARKISYWNYPWDTLNLLMQYPNNQEKAFEKLNEYLHRKFPISQYLKWYDLHVPSICLSPGAKETLDYVASRGWGLGIITDGKGITQRNKLLALGIDHYFEFRDTLIWDEVFTKPDMPIDLLFRTFIDRHPDCKEFVYIADNTTKDFRFANLLGWRTIGLRDNGQNIHPQNQDALDEEAPQLWIDNLHQLIDVL